MSRTRVEDHPPLTRWLRSLACQVRLFRNLDCLPDELRHGAISIGNFDGVHLGHARIVEHLVVQARETGGRAVVFTFDPAPASILRPDRAPLPLCTTARKVELLAQLGVDAVIACPTDEAFLKLDPREFFDTIVVRHLRARAVVEGPNFSFGRSRQGNVALLRALCGQSDVALEVVDPVQREGQIVSSSRIRRMLSNGQVDRVRQMLTQPYRIGGRVVRGAGRGMELGYPTANIDGVGTLLPGEGIYAGRAWVDGRAWPAAISLGPNPTFAEDALKVEAHLVGYAGQLYDRNIEVDFLKRLRNIVRFDSVGELVAQMDRDVAALCQITAQYDQ